MCIMHTQEDNGNRAFEVSEIRHVLPIHVCLCLSLVGWSLCVYFCLHLCFVSLHKNACIYVCIYMHTHTCKHTYVYICMPIHTNKHTIKICEHICTPTNAHFHLHTFMHIFDADLEKTYFESFHFRMHP